MTTVALVEPTEEVLVDLVARLRPADAAEVRAGAPGQAVLDVAREHVARSAESWGIEVDGELLCVWGVVAGEVSLSGGAVGYPWLFTTTTVDRYPKVFWRASKSLIRDLLLRWDTLEAAVDVRYEKALRWAARLGFTPGRLDDGVGTKWQRVAARGSS